MELGPCRRIRTRPRAQAVFGFLNRITFPGDGGRGSDRLSLTRGQSERAPQLSVPSLTARKRDTRSHARRTFPGRVKAAGPRSRKHWPPNRPTVRIWLRARPRPSSIRLSRRNRYFTPRRNHRDVRASMKDAHAEVEIYPGTHHGFAFPKRPPIYDRDAAEGLGNGCWSLSPQSSTLKTLSCR